ncbi:MAG: ABC transporter permease, partial [Rickettsiales bacterium]|nr:ABC transporter permease [Rickettsiales bacterium]
MNKIKTVFAKIFPSSYEWMIAKRYLRGRAKDKFFSVITWFSLIGIAIGVSVLIAVMSVMNGFREEMLKSVLGINGHIMVYSATGKTIEDYDGIVSQINANADISKHITFVMPLTEGQVMLASQGKSKGGLVRGIKGNDMKQYRLLDENIYGTDFEKIEDDEVIIGDKLAFVLGLRIGDEITITSANGNITAFGIIPRIRTYRIAGTFNVGMYQYDSSFVFMKLQPSQFYLNMEGAVSHIEIFTDNPENTGVIKNEIQQMIGSDYRVLDWKDLNASFFNALNIQKNM